MSGSPPNPTSIRGRWHNTVDAAVETFNNWLGSRTGFLQALAVSLLWNGIVLAGWDKHGFLYLYIATELGIITQFNLAIIGRRSSAKVDAALDSLLALARDEVNERSSDLAVQKALIAQGEAMTEIVRDLQLELSSRRRRA